MSDDVVFRSVSADEAEWIAQSFGPGAFSLMSESYEEWKFEEGCDNGLIGKDFRWLHCPVCGSEELCTVELGPTWEFIGCQCGWGEE